MAEVQVGVIVFGGGLNEKVAIEEAKKKGYNVIIKDDHALVMKDDKKKK